LRPSLVVYLYWRRLRSYGVQELLAGGGIAVGVALLVGVLAASATFTRAGDELIRGFVGKAQYTLAAPTLQQGFSERTAEAAGALPGVRTAVYLLRENVSIGGPHGRVPVHLIGVSSNLDELGGDAVGQAEAEAGVLAGGLAVPAGVANSIGAHVGATVTVYAGGEARRVALRALVGSGHAATSTSPIAFTLLAVAQRLTGMPHTVSGVLIAPQPGSEAIVKAGLKRLAGRGLAVEAADAEVALIGEAAGPIEQSTRLFAAIGAAIGFLLALNAMLLTAPERRRFVADLQADGYDWRQVLLVVGFQVLVLGLVASVVGVVAGELLARTLFHQPTLLLEIGFPLGTRNTVSPLQVAVGVLAGVLAAFAASAPVLGGLLGDGTADAAARALDAELVGTRVTVALAALATVTVAAVSAVVVADPGATVAGVIALGIAVICLVPAGFVGAVAGLQWLAERVPSSALMVTVRELRGTSLRAVVVAAVVALAVYSTTATLGGQRDVLGGIEQGIGQYFDGANVWVAPADNVLNINGFADAGTSARIAALPQVAAVRLDRGGLLDVGDRRMWVDARAPSGSSLLVASQVVSGNVATANARIRAGGWIAVARSFAASRHLRVGDATTLPTPSGHQVFRIAAITTNEAWPPGVLTLDAAQYARYWGTPQISAIEVALKPGVGPAAGRAAVAAALGHRGGLEARTAGERISHNEFVLHKQLESLTVISTLLLIAAAVAVALVLSAAIWQRRVRLASLKIQGYDHGQLWRALILESATVMTVGCVVGAVMGIYAHVWASRWLRIVSGFAAPFSPQGVEVLVTLALVIGVAVAVVALPGLAAARVSPRVSFEE
jgi:putative ABC transport system permease protein